MIASLWRHFIHRDAFPERWELLPVSSPGRSNECQTTLLVRATLRHPIFHPGPVYGYSLLPICSAKNVCHYLRIPGANFQADLKLQNIRKPNTPEQLLECLCLAQHYLLSLVAARRLCIICHMSSQREPGCGS